MARALITGIGGQDGYYLANLLLEKGYEVFGLISDVSSASEVALDLPFVRPCGGDVTDIASLIRACERVNPDEVYNLASQSSVELSFQQPLSTAATTGLGTLNILEAIRLVFDGAPPRFYQASSAELFGNAGMGPYNEETPFRPRSPYAISKMFAHNATLLYREAYGFFASTGICFNHESPRRSAHFVSRKITRAVARISLGLQSELPLGNLHARRDWGFAGEFVEAMWLALQHGEPDDFVIATGESHSVEEFVERAFACVGITDWQRHVRVSPSQYRPLEVDWLEGDSSKAQQILGWKPNVYFSQLVEMMVMADRVALQGSITPASSRGRA